jgi:hypothetical protein
VSVFASAMRSYCKVQPAVGHGTTVGGDSTYSFSSLQQGRLLLFAAEKAGRQ